MIGLILRVFVVCAGSLLDPGLELTNYQILQVSDYKFTFFNENPVPAGGKILVSLSGAFNINDSFTCNLKTPSVSTVCSFTDSILNVQISENIQSGQTFLLFFTGIMNPSPAQEYEISLKTENALGESIDNSTLTINYNPIPIDFVNIYAWSNTCGEVNNWNLTVDVNTVLPNNGSIEVVLPQWNTNLNPDTFEVFYSNFTYCYPECKISDNILSLQLDSGLIGNYTFTIFLIKNPPSTEAVSGFKVSIQYAGGLFLYSYDLPINITTSNPNTLKNPSVSLSQTKVSSPSEYLFSFTTANPIPIDSYIKILFPSTITITGNQIEAIKGLENKNLKISLNDNSLVLLNFVERYKESGWIIEFAVKNCNNPRSSKPAVIEIEVGYNNSLIDVYLEFEITATPGIINVDGILADDYIVNSIAIYELKFSSEEPIYQDYSVRVEIPEGIEASSEVYYKNGDNTKKDAGLLVENNIVQLKNVFSKYIGTDEVTFFIGSLKNPSSTKEICCFIIQIYEDSDYLFKVSENSTVSFQAHPGSAIVNIIPESLVTGECTFYHFSVFISNLIPDQGSFTIEIPTELKLSFNTLLNPQNLNENLKIDYFSSNSISISNCFTANFSGIFNFTLNCIKNPPSFQESSSFILTTYTQGFIIDRNSEGLSVQMNETHELQEFKVNSNSPIVSKTADFQFTLIPYNDLPNIILAYIYPPIGIVFGKSIVCSSSEVTVVYCSVINSILVMELKNIEKKEINIKAKNINNPPSTEPVSFKILLSTGVYDIEASSAIYSVSNPAIFKSLSAVINPNFISVQSELTLTYSLSTIFPDSGSFHISLSFLSDSVECYYNTLSLPCTYFETLQIPGQFSSSGKLVLKSLNNPSITGTHTLTITTFTNTNYSVESKTAFLAINCQSPCKTCEKSASTCTSCDFSSDFPYFYDNYCFKSCKSGYFSTNLKTCELCLSPCTQCYTSATTCSTCLSGYYLYKNSCTQTCPFGTFTDSTKCTSCTLPCTSCQSKTICESCTSPYTLYANKCELYCPDSYIQINRVCVPCSGCLTCTTSTNYCTSCIAGTFLFENSCLSQCPDGTLELGKRCEKCSANCLTCSKSINTCTGCAKGWVLQSNSCISQCSEGYFYMEDKCESCKFPCETCESEESCNSCEAGLFLQEDQCVSICDKGYFVSEVSCKPCPNTCSSCYDSSFCTECSELYYLFKTSCVLECPSGYFQFSGECITCENCEVCDKIQGCLSSCKDSKVFFQGTCLENCPSSTVNLSNVCISCDGCQECSQSPTNCTVCSDDLLLFNNLCLSTCPSGYIILNSTCVLNNTGLCSPGCTYSLLYNSICDSLCNNEDCQFDNGMCSKVREKEKVSYSNSYDIKQEPFVLSILYIGAIGVSAGISFISASNFFILTITASGCLETITKISMLACISEADGFKGRVLNSDNEKFSLIFGGIIGVLILHYLVNLSFIIVYWKYIRKNDHLHKVWTLDNKWGIFFILCIMYIFSFKAVLMIISNIPKIRAFNSKFNSETNLKNPFKYFQILYILIVFTPFVFLCSIALVYFSPGSLTYTLALDCIVLETLSFLMFIILFIYKPSNPPNSKYQVNKKGEEVGNTVVFTDALADYSRRNQGDLSVEEKREVEEDLSEKSSCPEPTTEGTAIKSLSNTPVIKISKDRIVNRNFSFNGNSLLPCKIENEDLIDFNEFEVDLDDLRRVYLKLKGYNAMFPVYKDFYPPVVIDDDDQIIDVDINFPDYELIAIDPENPKIGEFRHRHFNTRIRMIRNFQNTVIESYFPSPDSEITLRLENPLPLNYSSEEISNSQFKKLSTTALFRSGTPPKGTCARSLSQHPGLNISQDSIN